MRATPRSRLLLVTALVAAALGPASLSAQGSDAAGRLRPMLLHTAADSGYVYLSWNLVPAAAEYIVEWRREHGTRWAALTADSGEFHAAVSGLDNDVAYEFRVRGMNGSGATIAASPSAIETPRIREECNYTSDFGCTLSGLRSFLASSAGGPRFRCEGATIVEAEPNTGNCAYYSGTRVFGFDRFYGGTFKAPDHPASRSLIRDAGRRAIWGDEDPFVAPEQFRYEVRHLSEPDRGLVRADSVASYIIRLIPEVSSRFTIYRPADPNPGQYVIYHEGHGLTANTSGADFINWFLLRGWTVVGMDMPLEGANAPDARYPYDSHDALRWYGVPARHALDLFLLPVKVVVDQLAAEALPTKPTIVLAGRSGGGWTACMYGAIDDRITVAIDISGCFPRSVALDTATLPAPNVLHFETLQPVVYDQVSMLEFITAAGVRGNFHFYSVHDPSLRFRPGDAFIQYLNTIASGEREPRTQNRTRVHVGTQAGHGMDAAAFDALAQFMRDVRLPLREPELSTDGTLDSRP